MKRKIFTFVAAISLMALTVLPVSAAEGTCSVPTRFCFRPSYSCPILCPDIPEQDETPSVPETPEQGETPSVPETPSDSIPETGAMSQLELTACKLINERRAANGLEPLTISSDLSVKARIKSQDMKENRYFDHNSPTYGSPFELMKSLGITYRTAGENIAMGYRTAEAVVNAWMNSPGHRANILSASYDSFGIGHVDGYWTQWFIG